MAITMATLTSGNNTVDATSFTTASITPTANSLVLLALAYTKTPPAVPTITGNGLTWVNVTSVSYNSIAAPGIQIAVFRAMGASPSAGTVAISFGGATQLGCAWSFAEFAGVDQTGTNGSGAVVQSATNATDSTTATLTVTLSAFGSSNNVTYGAYGAQAAAVQGVGTGFTLIHETGYPTPNNRLLAEWKNANDTSVTFTPSTTGLQAAGIGIEINAAVSNRPITVSGTAGVNLPTTGPVTVGTGAS